MDSSKISRVYRILMLPSVGNTPLQIRLLWYIFALDEGNG